jgi:restriction system protein
VRRAFRSSDRAADRSDPYGLRKASPETAANTLLCLVNQASYHLRRQIQRLEQDFLDHGGFTERLYTVRSQARNTSDRSDPSDLPPACPKCGRPMQRRIARQGAHAGEAFWGCPGYPSCKGTRPAAS